MSRMRRKSPEYYDNVRSRILDDIRNKGVTHAELRAKYKVGQSFITRALQAAGMTHAMGRPVKVVKVSPIVSESWTGDGLSLKWLSLKW